MSPRTLLLFLCLLGPCRAWDEAELEIFDLVEEVNSVGMSFYEYLGLKDDASTSEVKKAYRSLSLKLHPDKNDAEDAEVRQEEFTTKLRHHFVTRLLDPPLIPSESHPPKEENKGKN